MGKRVIAYIDGFNLYFGAVKGHNEYKWLDLFKFCKLLMSGDDLLEVKYFTAKVNGNGDPSRPYRQKLFWDALKAINPNVKIIEGKFRIDKKSYYLAEHQYIKDPITKKISAPKPSNNKVYIIKPEEKGTDVNLAVHLVNDAYKDLFDIALVISNDSDLTEALKITKYECNKEIALANPHIGQLYGIALGFKKLNLLNRKITPQQLLSCQMPDFIPSTNIHKPSEWKNDSVSKYHPVKCNNCGHADWLIESIPVSSFSLSFPQTCPSCGQNRIFQY
ncbi:MAG: NYN domain-containing protein [Candidatus Latescibacterota bacterium]